MFGISFSEFLLILIILVAVTDPKDIPKIARYLAKIFFKIKNLINSAKDEVEKMGKEIGLEDFKNKVEEEIRKENEELRKTTIIDIYGNKHEVYDVEKIRGDLAKEDLQAEIEKYNKENELKATENKPKKNKKNINNQSQTKISKARKTASKTSKKSAEKK